MSHPKNIIGWTRDVCLSSAEKKTCIWKKQLFDEVCDRQIYLHSALWKASLYIHIFMSDSSRPGDYLFKGTANHFKKQLNIWKWFRSMKTFYTLCKSNAFGWKGLASVADSTLHVFNTEELDGLIFGFFEKIQVPLRCCTPVSGLLYCEFLSSPHDVTFSADGKIVRKLMGLFP